MFFVAASKHVRVLERAGLVRRRIDGRAHVCSIETVPLVAATEWLRFYEQFWTGRLDTLEAVLEAEDAAATRPGGKWKITNRRDGTDYTALGEYLEVDPPRRLVYTFAMPQFSPNSDTITIEIEPDGAGSAMTFTHSGTDVAAELSQLSPGEKSGSEQGWEQGFEALAAMFRNDPPA